MGRMVLLRVANVIRKLILPFVIVAGSIYPLQSVAAVPVTKTGHAAKPMQRAGGQPYELFGTQVWDVPDPVSHRLYQVFVNLPADYDQNAGRHYPVLYVTDADYAFPVIKQVSRRLNGEGPKIRDFILVGLSYAKGDDGQESRDRDYTPSVKKSPPDAAYGQGPAYQRYLHQHVIPFIAAHFRTDESSRFFLGHSYGGLLGVQILLSDPGMFKGYILGSPSLWYDGHAVFQLERSYAQGHHDLPADVYFYVGEYEDIRPGDPRFAKTYNMVTDLRTFTGALRGRHYPSLHLQLEVLNDEDHLSVAPRGAIHGLKRLLAIR